MRHLRSSPTSASASELFASGGHIGDSRFAPLFAIVAMTACASSGASGVSNYTRGSLASQIGCAPTELKVSEHGQNLGNETWRVACQGVTYDCTRAASVYGGGPSCKQSHQQLPVPALAEKSQDGPAPAVVPQRPAAEPSGTTEIRATLDRERDSILACSGGPVLGIKAQAETDRSLTVRLSGTLAGSAEEACVQHLLSSIRLQTAPPGTLVVHVVHR